MEFLEKKIYILGHQVNTYHVFSFVCYYHYEAGLAQILIKINTELTCVLAEPDLILKYRFMSGIISLLKRCDIVLFLFKNFTIF